MVCLLTPSGRLDVQRVSIGPEVVALRVAIKVKPEAVPAHLSHGQHTEEGRVLRVDAFKFHTGFKAVFADGEGLYSCKHHKY